MLFQRVSPERVPGFQGWYEPADPRHRATFDSADLLVTVEDRNMYPRVVGDLPRHRKLAITSSPAATRKNQYLTTDDVLVGADPAAALDRLTELLVRRDTQVRNPWYPPAARAAAAPRQRPSSETAAVRNGLVRVIGTMLRRMAGSVVLVDDSQMLGGLIAEEYDELPPWLRVFGDHGAFVGSGIAQSTGLAMTGDSRVLCCLGDQGFTNGVQGLVAAVQEHAPVTFLVCNNGGAVSLRKQSLAGAGRLRQLAAHPHLSNPVGASHAGVARAFGVPSWHVDLATGYGRPDWSSRAVHGLEQLAEVLDEAVALRGPALIELALPEDQAFWTGVWTTSGLEASQESPAALLFDLDGVLVHSHAPIERAWRRWADRYGVDWSTLAPHIVGQRAVDTIRAVLPDLPAAQVEQDAVDINQEQQTDVSDVYPVAGMPQLVTRAVEEGTPWAVVTGCPRPLAIARLAAAGYPAPPVLVTAEDVAAGKPAPDGYLHAAAELAVPADRCVVLEDSASGVAAGRAAGATVIGVRTGAAGDLSAADLVVTDATQLPWPLAVGPAHA
jgi:beta-phosphoglucomutase-like phosphatase (HAD superfamily)